MTEISSYNARQVMVHRSIGGRALANPIAWRLRLLGDFALERDGVIVHRFGTRKEELLLAYLALAPHTALLRETVAAEFWPLDRPSIARKNLSYNLSILRSRFSQYGLHAPFAEGRATTQLSAELTVDADEFGQVMLGASVEPVESRRVQLLERALAMYGGGLLPTYVQPWLTPHQARFGAMYDQAVLLLTDTRAPDSIQRAIMVHVPSTAWGRQVTGQFHESKALPPAGDDADASAPPAAPSDDCATQTSHNTLLEMAQAAEIGLRSEDAPAWIERLHGPIAELEAAADDASHPSSLSARDECIVRSMLWRYWYRTDKATSAYYRLLHLTSTATGLSAATEANAMYATGSLAIFAGETHKAIEHLRASLQLWRHVENPTGLLGALMNLGVAHHRLGAYAAAKDAYSQAMGIARLTGDDFGLGLALVNSALIALEEGDTQRARGLLDERRRMMEDDKQLYPLFTIEAYQAMADLIDGDLVAAQARASSALELAQRAASTDQMSHAYRLLGCCDHRQGDLTSAQQWYERAVDAGQVGKCYRETGASLGYLALCRHMQGFKDEAARLMFSAIGLLRSEGDLSEVERFRIDMQRLFPEHANELLLAA